MHSVLDWMNCFNSWLVPDSLKMDACLASFAGFSSVIDLLGQFLFLVGGAGLAETLFAVFRQKPLSIDDDSHLERI